MQMRPSLWDYARGRAAHRRHRRNTMVGRRRYAENIALCAERLRDPELAQGAIVECGAWRGGMAAGLIDIAGPERTYLFFDVFEELPPAGEKDGAEAKAWQAGASARDFRDNCRVSLEEFQRTIAATRFDPAKMHVYKGLFADTFPTVSPPPIAVLRLDGDWYASTMECLEKFWDHVLPGGLILIDDYYDWDGCARAVHDFLSRREATERILQGPRAGVAAILREKKKPS